MAPSLLGGDTLIISGQCTHRDHICMVGFPALCSWLSYGMDMASISFEPRIKFTSERSENLTKVWECVLGTYTGCPCSYSRKCPTHAHQGIWVIRSPGSAPILTIGVDGRRILLILALPLPPSHTYTCGRSCVCERFQKKSNKSKNPCYPPDILRFICNIPVPNLKE